MADTRSKIFAAAGDMINTAGETTTMIVQAFLSHQAIEIARANGDRNNDNEHPVRDAIALASSAVSATFLVKAFVQNGLFAMHHWGQLSNTQIAFLGGVSLLIGGGGFGYAMDRFGIEKNEFAAEMAGAAGLLGLHVARNVLTYLWPPKNQAEDEQAPTEGTGLVTEEADNTVNSSFSSI